MSNVRRSDRRSAEALRMAMVPSQLSALILFAIILTGSVGKLRAADDVKPEPPVGQVREEQTALSQYADMPLPKAADLLRARPFDWVVLKTQDVLVVDPLPMRPDPIARVTVKHETAQQAYNRVLKNRPYKETELASLRQFFKNNDRVDEFDATEARLKEDLEKSRERADSLRPQTYKIPVTLRDGSVDPEYVVDLRFVDFVVHFEDLVLRRATQLITEGRVALAYDLLVLVARRQRENNLIIQNELESEERELLGRIKNLEAERGSLRASKEELNALAGRNSPGAKGRLSTLDKTVAKISAEIKEIEEELRGVRFKLRFARPKDFPKPEPVRKDDLLLPSWPKFDETYQKLVFKDADLHVERGQPEQAFRLLEELTGEIPGLSTRLGRTADLLIAPCVDRQDFRQARFFLSRLATRDPSNSVVQKWRDDLAARTSTVMQEALAAATRGEAALAAKTIDRAARIWPETAGLKETHRDLNDRHQVL